MRWAWETRVVLWMSVSVLTFSNRAVAWQVGAGRIGSAGVSMHTSVCSSPAFCNKRPKDLGTMLIPAHAC